MLNLRTKLLIPTILTAILAVAGIVYISILQYNLFQHQNENRMAEYKQHLHLLIGNLQEKTHDLIELLSNKWHFLDSLSAGNMDILLNELTPFHRTLGFDFIAVYDMEGITIVRGDSPGHFGMSDGLYEYIMKLKKGKARKAIVTLYDNKLLLLELKCLETSYKPIGFLAVGNYIDEKTVNNFARLHQLYLAFEYKNAEIVYSNNSILPENIDRNRFRVEFIDELGQASPLSAILWEDTSKIRSKFLNHLFIVIIGLVLMSCMVIYFSRRIIVNTVNALDKARASAERVLSEWKQAEEALKQLNEELEERVQARTKDLEDEIIEHKRAKGALRESEERFRSIFSESPIGVELFDSGGNLIDANPKCLEIFGIRNVEVVKGFKLFGDPNIPDEVKKRIFAGESVNYESEFDFDKVRELELYEASKTGKTFVQVFLSPWKASSDGQEGFLVHVMDITDRNQAEEELKKYRDHLEELVEVHTNEFKEKTDKIEESRKALTYLVEDVNKAREDLGKANRDLGAVNKDLQDFAYIVSHDLKAPLRAVSQLAYWISQDYAEVLDEEGKKHLNFLRSRVKRMDGLINGILQYSRLGRIRERQEKIDFGKILRDVIEALAPPENFQTTIEGELPEIVGNRTHMEQVFQNLLSNSIRFMDKPEGIVTIGCEDEGSHWEFRITDNGPGIEEKYHERIFKIFQTLAPRDEHESTGIGLTLVKKTIEEYGGKVWVESEVGKGSSFVFTLPKK